MRTSTAPRCSPPCGEQQGAGATSYFVEGKSSGATGAFEATSPKANTRRGSTGERSHLVWNFRRCDPGWGGSLRAVSLSKSGRTNATRYFVPPALLREAGLDALTTLKRVQPHRLRALILEDLERFPDSAISDVHRRIGPEISSRTVKRAFDLLVSERTISATGERRWRRYRLAKPIDQGGSDGR